MRDVFYSKKYNISIKSCNVKYCSIWKRITIENYNVINTTDQVPELIHVNKNSLTFCITKPFNKAAFVSLYIIVQDHNKTFSSARKPILFENNVGYQCNYYGESWVSVFLEVFIITL